MLSSALEEHAKTLADFSRRFKQNLTVKDVVYNLCPDQARRDGVMNIFNLMDTQEEVIADEKIWIKYMHSRDAFLKNGLRDVKNLTWCKLSRECGLACTLGDADDPEIFAMISKEGEQLSLWNVKFFRDAKNFKALLRCECPEVSRISVTDRKPTALEKLREANSNCDVII